MTRLLILALTAVLALPGLSWLLARCEALDDARERPGYIVLPGVYDSPDYASRARAGPASAAARAGTPIDTRAGRAAATIAPPSATNATGDR